VLTAAIYGQTVTYGFVYEDQNDPETFFSLERPAGNRWITAASYRLSQRVSGLEPWGFHLGNVIAHVGNGALLMAVLPETWPAVFGIGVFMLHPLQVEAVAYISNRAELLVVTWCLLALLAVQARQWWLVAVCALGALLTKETGVMVLPLVGLWCLWRRVVVPRSAWIGVAAVGACGVALAARWGLTSDGWWVMQETTKALWLLSRLVVPTHLSADHAWDWISPAIAICGMWIGVMALLWSQRSKTAGFVALWMAVVLLPRLVVPLYEGIHEHHLYGAVLGLSLGVGFIAPVSRSRTC
jgi:hypothetical protein